MSKNDDRIGDRYQEETKYTRENVGGGLDWSSRAETYKIHDDPLCLYRLPEPDIKSGAPLWNILNNRRSVRKYGPEPATLPMLSQLLWACSGVTLDIGDYQLRTSPSAGALYPVETYVAINRGDGIAPGIFHYEVRNHSLEMLREGNYGREVADACLGQVMCARAAAVFIFSAIPGRSKWKYRERAYRYIYMDAGHAGAGLHLAAESLGLGCCMIGAFFDDEVNSIIGADGETESAIYLASVGSK